MMRRMIVRQPQSASSQTQTVLLTLGRLPVALDLARGFFRLGWRVVVAEPLGMHLCRMSRAVDRCHRIRPPGTSVEPFLNDVLSVIREEGVDLVVPVSEELLAVSLLRDRLPAGVDLFAAEHDHVVRLHDKLAFNQMAAALGLTVPRSWSGSEGLGNVPDSLPLVVKPRFSCSGRGIRFETAATATADRGEIIQERIDGTELSYFGLARGGALFDDAVYRARVRAGSVAVCFEQQSMPAAIRNWVDVFARETHHTGFLAFDFIVDEAGSPFALECNPRATSGLHFLSAVAVAAWIAEEPLSAGDPTRSSQTQGATLTESWSCYTEVLDRVVSGGDARAAFSDLRRARDVTWSPNDPWPFLLMPINTWPLLWRAISSRRRIAATAMTDLEWRVVDG